VVGAHGIGHGVRIDAQPTGDLVAPRRSPESLFEQGTRRAHVVAPVLTAARDAHLPAEVSEVPTELAEDGRHGERRELGAAARIEPLDGLDQADPSDLEEIVVRLAPADVPPGASLRQSLVVDEQPVGRARRPRRPRSGSRGVRVGIGGRGTGRARDVGVAVSAQPRCLLRALWH
jgi:hypothetical protein